MTELERRKEDAVSAIRASYGTTEGEYAATLFVTHHLEELDEACWNKHLQTSAPQPMSVLDLLVLRSHWSEDDDDGMDTLDFTLPNEVTDYVISVRFNADGNVESIEMES